MINIAGFVGSMLLDPSERLPALPWNSAPLSESLLARLLESSPDCIKILDLDGRLTFMSAGGLCAMDLDDSARLIGAKWQDFWSGQERGLAQRAISEARADRIFRFQGSCLTAKAKRKWWDVVVSPMAGPDGKPDKLLAFSRDITDQKRLETELRGTVARHRALTEASSFLFWRAATDGRIVEANGDWEALSGEGASAFLGSGWLELVHPDEKDGLAEAWNLRVRTGASGSLECRIRAADGTYRWVVASWAPVHGEHGGVTEFAGTLTDVHEQRTAQAKLRASEERYRALIEASASACWYATPAGDVAEISGWGAFPHQKIGPVSGSRWLDGVHPDDRERARATWIGAVDTGTYLFNEYRMLVGDHYRWVQARAVPLRDEDGAIKEWVGTVADIQDKKSAEESIRSAEERYRLAARATQDAVWDWNLDTDELIWGGTTYELLGYGDADIEGAGTWWDANIHPDDCDRVLRGMHAALDGSAETWTDEYRFRRGDGAYADVLDRGYIIRDPDGCAIRMVGAMQDLTQRKRAEDALRGSEERLRVALRAGRMVPWRLHVPSGHVTRGETSFALLGIGSGPASDFLDRVVEEDRSRIAQFLERGPETFGGAEVRYMTPAGRMVWLSVRAERSGPDEIVGVNFDITDRKKTEEEVWHVANHDPLTGLPNRTLLRTRAEKALADARRDTSCLSMLHIGLDGFKDINDTLGHDAGDAVLRETARRLSTMVRHTDVLARVGGDEFTVVLTDPLRLEHALRFAQLAREALKDPIVYRDTTLTITVSIGLASFPDHDQCLDELVKDADLALYHAKREGRDRVVTYSPELRDAARQKFQVLGEVREALAADGIVPFYQPKVCLESGEIIGFEALARWLHPTRGVLTPAAFAAAFDHPDLSLKLGTALVDRVLVDLRSWLDAGLAPGRVAVNFSSTQFSQPDLADELLNRLADSGVPASRFEVEVTETVFLGRNSEQTSRTLKRLHEAGIHIALDDFGTGFASLSHLKQFPVDHIKIDQSFIRNLERDEGDAAIVRAVIGLGQSLGLEVTAEGVETAKQAECLRSKGCDFAQGYLYSKPVPGSDVPNLLQTRPYRT